MYKLIIFALAIATIARIAQAQSVINCGNRDSLIKTLEQKYGEKRRVYALTNRGGVIEIFTNSVTTTWTAILSNPQNKVSCIVSSGEAWTETPIGEQL